MTNPIYSISYLAYSDTLRHMQCEKSAYLEAYDASLEYAQRVGFIHPMQEARKAAKSAAIHYSNYR